VSVNLPSTSFKSSGALANTGRVVYFSADKTVSVATDKATHNGIGILDGKATAANQAVPVTLLGEAIAEAGDTIAAGKWLAFDGSGRPIEAAAGDNKIGYSLEAASGVGVRFRMFVLPGTEL